MDLSKLPKLSQTAEAEKQRNPSALPSAEQPPYQHPPAKLNTTFEASMSLLIGAILLLVFPQTLQWLFSLISSYHPPFLPITDSDNNEVPYLHSIFFMAQFSVFVFSLALLLDGLVLLLLPKTLPVILTLTITLLAILINLYYVVSTLIQGQGLAITSALAVAIGAYMMTYQWKLISTRA